MVVTPTPGARHHRRLLPHRHRRPHRALRQLHRAADRRAARAVRRQQRAVLHQRDRHADQRRRRDRRLPHRPGAGGDVRLRAGYNNTRTKIVGDVATPPQLAGFESGAVRSDRAAADRVRPAARQPAPRRRLAPQPARRRTSISPLRRVLQLHARTRPTIRTYGAEVADRRRGCPTASAGLHAGGRRRRTCSTCSRTATPPSIRSTASRRSRASRRSA